MTDYKNLKLIATSSPHIRGSETTRSIMLDVIIAMLPALIWAVVMFGIKALTLTVVSVIGCMFWEWLYRTLMKLSLIHICGDDGSAGEYRAGRFRCGGFHLSLIHI